MAHTSLQQHRSKDMEFIVNTQPTRRLDNHRRISDGHTALLQHARGQLAPNRVRRTTVLFSPVAWTNTRALQSIQSFFCCFLYL